MNPNSRRRLNSSGTADIGRMLEAMRNSVPNISAADYVSPRAVSVSNGSTMPVPDGTPTELNDVSPPQPRVDNNKEHVKIILKQRNLTREERARYHKPGSDYYPSTKGEIKKAATTLEVADLISKFSQTQHAPRN